MNNILNRIEKIEGTIHKQSKDKSLCILFYDEMDNLTKEEIIMTHNKRCKKKHGGEGKEFHNYLLGKRVF